MITESAAICLHIGEKYPEKRLLPDAGTPDPMPGDGAMIQVTTLPQPTLAETDKLMRDKIKRLTQTVKAANISVGQ